MLTVTRDVLRFLEITNIYFIGADNRQHFAYLAEIGSNQFSLKMPDDVILTPQMHIKVYFKLRSYIEVEVTVLSASIGFCTVTAYKPTEEAIHLLMKFTNLDSQNLIWSRRREERYDLALANFERLGLRSPQQMLIMDGIKYPMALKNISQHGLQVVTYANSASRRTVQLALQLSFKDPLETITLTGNNIRQTVAAAKNSTRRFATISIQLIEPVPFSWRRRVVAYADRLSVSETVENTD